MKHRLESPGRVPVFSIALLALSAASSLAQIPGPGVPGVEISVGPQISTLGIGAGAAVRLAGTFGASIEYHFTPGLPSIDVTASNNEVTGDLSVHGGTLMATWHPTGSSFAVGAGILFGGARADLLLEPDVSAGTTVDLGDGTYDLTDIGTITGEVDYAGLHPVFAVGLMGSGLNVVLGAAIVEPTANLSSDGILASNPTFRANLNLEIEEVRDGLSKVPVYPYLRIGWKFGVL